MKVPRSTCHGIERQFVHSAIFLNSCFGPFREPLMPATFTYYTQHVRTYQGLGRDLLGLQGNDAEPDQPLRRAPQSSEIGERGHRVLKTTARQS